MRNTIAQCRKALVDELSRVHSSEVKMASILPSLWTSAEMPELADLLRQVLSESHLHARLLRELQSALGGPICPTQWEGFAAAVNEMLDQAAHVPGNHARDLMLVGGLIRIKGLKIAGYNVVRSIAENLQSHQMMTIIIKMVLTEMEGEIKLFEIASELA